jgi:hypothetical protein
MAQHPTQSACPIHFGVHTFRTLLLSCTAAKHPGNFQLVAESACMAAARQSCTDFPGARAPLRCSADTTLVVEVWEDRTSATAALPLQSNRVFCPVVSNEVCVLLGIAVAGHTQQRFLNLSRPVGVDACF